MMRFINSINVAEHIKRILEYEGAKIQMIHTDRDKRSLHIDLLETEKDKTITHHVKFSKELFNSFGYYFPEYTGQKGETLNETVIRRLPENTILYFGYHAEIRSITLKEFLAYDLSRIAKSGQVLHSMPFDDIPIFWNDDIQKEDFFGLTLPKD